MITESSNTKNYISKFLSKGINKIFGYGKKIECVNHFNCSAKILTMNSYCCKLKGFCCSWFEHVLDFQYFSDIYPFKSPSSLTIIFLLLIFVILFIIFYCLTIFFCFQFKFGLFKRPKLTIITENTIQFENESDSINAQIFPTKRESIKLKQKNFLDQSKKNNFCTKGCSPCMLEASQISQQISTNNLSSRSNSKQNCYIYSCKNCSSSNQNKNKNQNKNFKERKINSKDLSSDNSIYHPFLNSLNEFSEDFNSNSFVTSSESSPINELRRKNSANNIQETNSDQWDDTALTLYNDEKPPSYYDIIKRKH